MVKGGLRIWCMGMTPTVQSVAIVVVGGGWIADGRWRDEGMDWREGEEEKEAADVEKRR